MTRMARMAHVTEQMISVPEAAERLGITPAQAYELVFARQLRTVDSPTGRRVVPSKPPTNSAARSSRAGQLTERLAWTCASHGQAPPTDAHQGGASRPSVCALLHVGDPLRPRLDRIGGSRATAPFGGVSRPRDADGDAADQGGSPRWSHAVQRCTAFRIVLGDGYGAGGVLLNGNIEVEDFSG